MFTRLPRDFCLLFLHALQDTSHHEQGVNGESKETPLNSKFLPSTNRNPKIKAKNCASVSSINDACWPYVGHSVR